MDDKDRDEILWRLDERTERIDDRMERVDIRVTHQEEELSRIQSDFDEAVDDLDRRVTRNSTILTGITFGLSMVVVTIMGKLHTLLSFK